MLDVEIIEEINDGIIYLRKISLDDSNFVFETLKNDDVSNFLSLGPLLSQDHSKRLIKNYLQCWEKKLQFNFIIEIRDGIKKNKKVGSISLWSVSWLHNRAEIGIWLDSKYWNQSIAKKALELIKILAFVHLKLNRIEGHMAIENTKSINLFKKCSFSDEGTLKQYLYLKGKYHDAKVFSCLNSFL